ncbi:hypothetical protein EG359_13880 [Chryseobacterium joostei]|uniref:Uncharacterized protein n=1 Tax=Chryseobacterium joostei TaxID=112234 RepID=A0ABM7BMW1_9FLAO|nr:hypothetical protein [Chryseobacterium joostei]AZB00641.1 hypothetical protein EG359_13880 [Chryseobacterium joostei]
MLDEDAPITYNNAKRNEELGTNTDFQNEEINGLVMVRTGSKSYRLNSQIRTETSFFSIENYQKGGIRKAKE